MWGWWLPVAHFFGTRNNDGNSSGYLFWSGVGSDLAYIGAVAALLRHGNCEVHGCWRFGRHATAAGHKVCRRHHPDDKLTAADVTVHHETAMTARTGALPRPQPRR